MGCPWTSSCNLPSTPFRFGVKGSSDLYIYVITRIAQNENPNYSQGENLRMNLWAKKALPRVCSLYRSFRWECGSFLQKQHLLWRNPRRSGNKGKVGHAFHCLAKSRIAKSTSIILFINFPFKGHYWLRFLAKSDFGSCIEGNLSLTGFVGTFGPHQISLKKKKLIPIIDRS